MIWTSNIITTDMVGRSVDMFYTKERHPIGDVVLEVRDLQLTRESPKVSFDVHEGEILGIAGMVGSGRTELVRALTGADRYFGGSIKYKGEELSFRSPRDSITQGFAHITEDRQQLGLMLGQNILENMTIVGLGHRLSSSSLNWAATNLWWSHWFNS